MQINGAQITDLYDYKPEYLKSFAKITVMNVDIKRDFKNILDVYNYITSFALIEFHLIINDVFDITLNQLQQLKLLNIYSYFTIDENKIKELTDFSKCVSTLHISHKFYPVLNVNKNNTKNVYLHTKLIYDLGFLNIYHLYNCKPSLSLHIQIYKIIKMLKIIYNDKKNHAFSFMNYEDYLVKRFEGLNQKRTECKLFRFYNNSLNNCKYINSKLLQDIEICKSLNILLESLLKCDVSRPEYIIKLQTLSAFYNQNKNSVLPQTKKQLMHILNNLKETLK